METPREAWSGSRHRSPSTCKVMSFMVVGTGRPRALAAVPVRWILRLSSSDHGLRPRCPRCYASSSLVLRLRLGCRGNRCRSPTIKSVTFFACGSGAAVTTVTSPTITSATLSERAQVPGHPRREAWVARPAVLLQQPTQRSGAFGSMTDTPSRS